MASSGGDSQIVHKSQLLSADYDRVEEVYKQARQQYVQCVKDEVKVSCMIYSNNTELDTFDDEHKLIRKGVQSVCIVPRPEQPGISIEAPIPVNCMMLRPLETLQDYLLVNVLWLQRHYIYAHHRPVRVPTQRTGKGMQAKQSESLRTQDSAKQKPDQNIDYMSHSLYNHPYALNRIELLKWTFDNNEVKIFKGLAMIYHRFHAEKIDR